MIFYVIKNAGTNFFRLTLSDTQTDRQTESILPARPCAALHAVAR